MKEITNKELKNISTRLEFDWNAESQKLKVDFDGNPMTLGLMLGEYLISLDQNKTTKSESVGVALAFQSAVSYWKQWKDENQ